MMIRLIANENPRKLGRKSINYCFNCHRKSTTRIIGQAKVTSRQTYSTHPGSRYYLPFRLPDAALGNYVPRLAELGRSPATDGRYRDVHDPPKENSRIPDAAVPVRPTPPPLPNSCPVSMSMLAPSPRWLAHDVVSDDTVPETVTNPFFKSIPCCCMFS